MRLYDIDQQLVILLDRREELLKASLGEITPEMEALELQLNDYLAASKDKIEAALMVIKQLETDAENLRDREKHLCDRRKSVEGNVERLRGLVAHVIDVAFGGKVKTLEFTASVAESKPAVNVSLAPDADAIKCFSENPGLFKRPELNKTAIKECADSLKGVPKWLVIEELPAKRSLRIR